MQDKNLNENAGEESLGEDVRNIISGVLTITLIVVPLILSRKLVKSLEQSEGFQNLNDVISGK